MQEKYRKVAFIMNRPCGPMEDRGYREFIQKKALEGISLRMRLLDESCGVMNVFFGTASADSSSNHYQFSSSDRLGRLVKEEVAGGILGRIIAQTFLVSAPQPLTKRKGYSSFFNDPVDYYKL